MLKFQAKSALLIAFKQWTMNLRLNTFGEKQRSLVVRDKCRMRGEKSKLKQEGFGVIFCCCCLFVLVLFFFKATYSSNLNGTTPFLVHKIAKT